MASTRFDFDLRANVGQFRRGFRQADRAARGFSNRMGVLQSRVTQVGAALATFFGGRALASGFRAIVGEAADLEEQMGNVQAVSRATAEEMERLRATAVEMGESTTFTAVEAAGAMENLARAGLNASEQIETIPQVLQFAQANSLQLAEAASVVTSAVNGMGLEFSESQRVTDVFTAAAQNADTTVQDLGSGLSFVASTANSLGMDIEQTTALIATLADAGFEGSRAGTALNSVLSQFQRTTSPFQKALQDAGIENENFAQTLQELERGVPGAEEAINSLGTEAGRGLRQLLLSGSEAIKSFTTTLNEAEGATKRASDTMTDDLIDEVDRLGSAWNTLKRELGDPILGRVTQAVKDLAQGIKDFVRSDDLGRLQQSLVRTWDRGRAAVERFLADFDISQAARGVIDTIGQVSSAFGRLAAGVKTAGAAIRAVWAGVNSAVSVVLQIIANSIASVMSGIARVQEGLNAVGLASEESARKARMHAEAMRATARELGENSSRQFGRMIEATNDLGESFGDLTRSTDSNTNAQRDGAAAARDHANAADQQAASFRELRSTTELTAAAVRAAGAANERGGEQAQGASMDFETLGQTMDGVADAAEQARDRIDETGDEAQDSADEFGEAQDRNQQAAQETADAVDNVAESGSRAASELGGASAALRNMITGARAEFEALGQGAAEAFDEIVERSALTGRSVGNFLDDLGERRDRLRQDIEAEQASLARMQQRIESASGSTEDLAQIARLSTDQFRFLGEERLRPVRDAIADAQRRLESMRESATSTLQSLQEELLRTQGREEELAELRRERRRQDLQEQLSQAQAAGDQESVSTLREALQTLDQIGEAERRQRRERERERRRREQEQAATADEGEPAQPRRPAGRDESRRAEGGGSAGSERRVRLEIDGPDDTATVDADEDQAERLIEQLNRAGRRTS